jgi:hypothetical protein
MVMNLVTFDLVYCVPANIERTLVANSVENAVAAEHYEVMEVRSYLKLRDFGLRNDHSFLPTILWPLRFDVTKSA